MPGMFLHTMSTFLYDMILGRYLLTYLVINLKFSKHVIEEYDGNLKVATSYMFDLSTY